MTKQMRIVKSGELLRVEFYRDSSKIYKGVQFTADISLPYYRFPRNPEISLEDLKSLIEQFFPDVDLSCVSVARLLKRGANHKKGVRTPYTVFFDKDGCRGWVVSSEWDNAVSFNLVYDVSKKIYISDYISIPSTTISVVSSSTQSLPARERGEQEPSYKAPTTRHIMEGLLFEDGFVINWSRETAIKGLLLNDTSDLDVIRGLQDLASRIDADLIYKLSYNKRYSRHSFAVVNDGVLIIYSGDYTDEGVGRLSYDTIEAELEDFKPNERAGAALKRFRFETQDAGVLHLVKNKLTERMTEEERVASEREEEVQLGTQYLNALTAQGDKRLQHNTEINQRIDSYTSVKRQKENAHIKLMEHLTDLVENGTYSSIDEARAAYADEIKGVA